MLERGGIRKCLFEGATAGFVGAGGPVKEEGGGVEVFFVYTPVDSDQMTGFKITGDAEGGGGGAIF
jgi:hypothetical protein